MVQPKTEATPDPRRSDVREIRRLDSVAPARGEVLDSVPVEDRESVDAAVARARAAAPAWAALTHAQRRRALLAFRRALAGRAEALAELIHQENGKTRGDAVTEVFGTCTLLNFAAKRAPKVLRSRRVSSGLMVAFRARVSHEPLGVVGVIGPWNMPMMTPMGSIAFALAAGNTVVFKPSELTPLCGLALVEAAQGVLPPDVLQVVTGDGSTGHALATAAVDKIAFTGSGATGRKVMAAAAEKLTPVVMELGGKDPMIVTAKADLDEAADNAVFGSLALTGQACISIERIYVEDAAYEDFVERVVTRAQRIVAGEGAACHIGAMTRPEQIEVVRSHVMDALQRGARALVGGLDSIGHPFVDPIVLVDVTSDMRVMREETFGPVISIMRVADVEEAIRLANDSSYGLGSAVFAGPDGEAIAERLRAGMTAVGGVWAPVMITSLPFGGVGESGFGRIHGDEGLKEFTRTKGTAIKRRGFPAPLSFGEPGADVARMQSLTAKLWGGRLVDGVGEWLRGIAR